MSFDLNAYSLGVLQLSHCMRFSSKSIFSPAELDDIFADETNWLVEEFLPNSRVLCVFSPDEYAVFSPAVVSCTDHFPLISGDISKLTDSFIVDCFYLNDAYVIFDCVKYNDEVLYSKSLLERRAFLDSVIAQLRSAGISCRSANYSIKDKRSFIRNCSYGVVFKNLSSIYASTSVRSTDWIYYPLSIDKFQFNAFIGGFLCVPETTDIFGLNLYAYIKGYDGSIEQKKITTVTSLPDDVKNLLYVNNFDKLEFNNDLLGKVVSVEASLVFADDFLFKTPVVTEWFIDGLFPSDCCYDEDYFVKEL